MAVLFYLVVSSFFTTNKALAASKYFIKINKSTNVVTVYNSSNKKAVKAFRCSGGSQTPIGTFKTNAKYKWRSLVGNKYGQYATRINGPYLFHSVVYNKNYNKASMVNAEYNKLGRMASHGCVRLAVINAKWIYDNCPLGTSVTIFKGSSKNDPLGKPSLYKVSTKKKLGWDPTDPDKNNPYRSVSLRGIKSTIKLSSGKTYDLRKGITAVDKAGSNLTKYIKIAFKKPSAKKAVIFKNRNYKFVEEGKYVITYSVKSPYSNVAKKKVLTINVSDTDKPTILGVEKNMNVQVTSEKNIKKNVVAITSSNKNITSSLAIRVKKPNDKDYSKYNSDTIKFEKEGKYYVEYSVIHPSNKKKAVSTVVYTSKDIKKPIIYGASSKEVLKDNTVDLLKDVTAKSYTGVDLTKKITVEVIDPLGEKVSISDNKCKFTKSGKYTITYRVKNDNGIEATEEVVYSVS